MTAETLEGTRIELDDGLAIFAGGQRRPEPCVIGSFANGDDELALAIAIEGSAEVRDDLASLGGGLAGRIRRLPRTRVAVIRYGGALAGGDGLEPAGVAADRLARLLPDPQPGGPALLAALDRALALVAAARPSRPGRHLRRVVLVVGDGRDPGAQPAAVRAAGERAFAAGTAILTLAYSPTDHRRPLLALGELARRSHGTFRWLRSRAGQAVALDRLVDELVGQAQVTCFVPTGGLVGSLIEARFRGLVSNRLRLGRATCGVRTCGAGEMCIRGRCLARLAAPPRRLGAWLGGLALGGLGGLALWRRRARGKPARRRPY